ncbi:MAG: hypothetical protein KC933_17070 [Myxococcales bacterium]|nr:hypothetical protein [Myxococcales bacterium]
MTGPVLLTSARSPRLLAALAVPLLMSCGAGDLKVVLSAAPSTGIAPLEVTFDVTGSRDLRGGALTVRYDFDGDGTFDTDPLSDPQAAFRYEAPGAFLVTAELAAADGRTATAQLTVTVSENHAPTAVITASPAAGRVPLAVTLDARGSADPDGQAIELRFDVDGYGAWDTEWGATDKWQGFLQTAGSLSPAVEVRDPGGLTAIARVSPALEMKPGADIDADVDRDGDIDDGDDLGEDTWGVGLGALLMANVDDDDRDGRPDGLDRILGGADDLPDLTPVRIRRFPGLEAADRVWLTVNPEAARSRVHVFGPDLRIRNLQGDTVELEPSDLATDDMTLYVEATEVRTPSWDGTVDLTLHVQQGPELLEDDLVLRVTPMIFTHHLQPAERLYAMRVTDRRMVPNGPFYGALMSMLPQDVQLVEVDEYDYAGDRWLQDPLQQGYQEVPGPDGPHRMVTYMKLERPTDDYGLEYFVENDLLGPDVGFAYAGAARHTSLSYGGNLEIAPPHAGPEGSFPLGRIVIGGGDLGLLDGTRWEDHMAQPQLDYMEAQDSQGPAVELSTEWLAVGHVDEMFLFLPDLNAGPNARPWKVVLASPDLAYRLLEEAQAAGAGDAPVFAGRQTQSTVNRVLADTALQEINDAAQMRLDTVREGLKASLGLTDDDFLELPVMYETFDFDGLELAAAYNPGIQNLVVANDVLLVPDPEGPDVNGRDPWADSARTTLERLGFRVQFVDVFDAYHLQLGEAHCGTLVERRAEPRWWMRYLEEALP